MQPALGTSSLKWLLCKNRRKMREARLRNGKNFIVRYMLVHITWIQTQWVAANFWTGIEVLRLRTDSDGVGGQYIFRNWLQSALWDLLNQSS